MIAKVNTKAAKRGSGSIRRYFSPFLGVLASVVFAVLAAQRAEFDIDMPALDSTSFALLSGGAALIIATWIAFAIRWKILCGPSSNFSTSDSFSYIVLGQFANTVLPFRLGDVLRLTLFSKKFNLNMGSTAAALILEKLTDLVLLLLIGLAASWFTDVGDNIRRAVSALAAPALMAIAVLVIIERWSGAREKFLSALSKILPEKLHQLANGLTSTDFFLAVRKNKVDFNKIKIRKKAAEQPCPIELFQLGLT